MLGDFEFLANRFARTSDEPLTDEDMCKCAWAAAKMVGNIGDYLPLQGISEDRNASWHVQEPIVAAVMNLYRATEAIRNPDHRPFGPGRGRSGVWMEITDGMLAPWVVLCDALDRVAEHYGWQAASEEGVTIWPKV
jgi:hypothetical protein